MRDLFWAAVFIALMLMLTTLQERSRAEECKSLCYPKAARFENAKNGRCWCQGTNGDIKLKKEW